MLERVVFELRLSLAYMEFWGTRLVFRDRGIASVVAVCAPGRLDLKDIELRGSGV